MEGIPFEGRDDALLIFPFVLSDTATFSGLGLLNSPVTVGDISYTDLLSVLNAWVDTNDTAGIYRRWAADSANVNGGYPVFAAIPCVTVTSSDTIVACDSYTWHGDVYTTSTELVDSLLTPTGCDSIVTHYLIVNQSTAGIDEQTTCESFMWIDGVTYTASTNTATYTLSNAVGCDSVVTLHLTITNTDHTDFTDEACNSYTWNGETYTESGDYTQTFTNSAGCDSVVTLHLTITNTDHTDFTDVACDSYTWNGETYTQSGDYTQTFTNSAGCDSVVTLHLTVNYSNTGDTTAVACENFTWYGTTFTESGDYTPSSSYWTTAAGCDSIVTLHLTINQPVSTSVTETACESFTWNGNTYTQSGDYQMTLTAANGCDSVVTLHLTIFEDETSEFSITTEEPCYSWNNTDYCASGDYTQTLQTVHGCDSVVTLHLTITVGIDDHGGFDFKVYPNPTIGVINAQCMMHNAQSEEAEIHVVDMYGKLVQTKTFDGESTHIDISDLASGVYFVKWVTDGQTVAVRKVVKQ